MQAEKLAKYLTELKNKTGLSYEEISRLSNRPESTVKNLCTGKTEGPRLDTVAPVIYALGGSIDEMLNPEIDKDEMKETSVLALKDVYESHMASTKETSEAHIANIRGHYERHIDELKESNKKIEEHYEKRLESEQKNIIKLENANRLKNIMIGILAGIFICLFIMEIMHPEHGWLRY